MKAVRPRYSYGLRIISNMSSSSMGRQLVRVHGNKFVREGGEVGS